MLRKVFLSTAAAVFMMVLSSSARADDVHFVGGFGATATVGNFSLVGNKFTFTVTNTAPSGSITAIGFDLSGTRPNTYTIFSSTDADFALAHDVDVQAGAVTGCGLNCGSFDLALLTGDNFGGGKVAEGIGPGGSATFVITGDFSGMTAQQIAQALSVRFQGINPGDQSTVAEPVPNPVPEPATLLLLGTGITGIAARVRRRRNKANKGATE